MEQEGTNSDPCSSSSPIGHSFLWTLCLLSSINKQFLATPSPQKKCIFGNHIYVLYNIVELNKLLKGEQRINNLDLDYFLDGCLDSSH